jgi:hypothetical protein
MADVEMTDAGAAPKTMKNTKAGASGDAEGKKKFEVKKVCWMLASVLSLEPVQQQRSGAGGTTACSTL